MKVQGYIEIDFKEMSDDQFDEFNQFLHQYFIYYYRIHKDSREYYFCIMENVETLPIIFEIMTDRNPIVNGLWDIDGLPYGQIKEVSIDPETQEEIIVITGEPKYSFDLDLHLNHTPSDKTYDEEGNIISETPITEFRPLHGFAGWALCQAY